jgi:hypothetical protein
MAPGSKQIPALLSFHSFLFCAKCQTSSSVSSQVNQTNQQQQNAMYIHKYMLQVTIHQQEQTMRYAICDMRCETLNTQMQKNSTFIKIKIICTKLKS